MITDRIRECSIAAAVWFCATVSFAGEPRQLRFESDVVPILRAYCWKCHGGEALEAGLDMRSLPLLIRGGKNGSAVKRGNPDESLILQRLTKGEMPPGNELRPTDQHIEVLREWLQQGGNADYEQDAAPSTENGVALEDRDWALRPPAAPAMPSVRSTNQALGPVDLLLLARLEQAGLGYSPTASRRTWGRRLHFDLLGLPPGPDELDEFERDPLPDAPERLIDKLLADPSYGERWGRHWLDAAGYVDTSGSDNDASIIKDRTGIWKYRDWVVRSLNRDKPYDEFLTEQLAGDELVDWRSAPHYSSEILDRLVATGFLRLAADVTDEMELNTADIRHQVLYDTVQIVAGNLLGLTVHCAQCHDHKFDPISQADYYRLVAIFAPAYNVQRWKNPGERTLPDVSAADKADIDGHNSRVDQQVAQLRQTIAERRKPYEDRLAAVKLSTIPEQIRADLTQALSTPADKRNEVQKYLAEKLGPQVQVPPSEVDQSLDDTARTEIAASQQSIDGLLRTKRSYEKIQAIWDVDRPSTAYLYRRGDYQTPGQAIAPAVPTAVDDPRHPWRIPNHQESGTSSGFRLSFAKWLTTPEHPLTGRVAANRLWQQYFGRGIVATSENFGVSGSGASHPEVLDYLAVRLVRDDWSLKRLHRLLVNSAVYRQSTSDGGSESKPDGLTKDPDNVWLWHMPLRRLESEIIRDSTLFVSGALVRRVGGPPAPLKSNPDGSVEIDTSKLGRPDEPFRRSLYILCRRNYQLTELATFDQPLVATHCTRRPNSAVVLQSLSLMNGKFVTEQAERLADRVRLSASDDTERVRAAFRRALSRAPDDDEHGHALELIQRLRERFIVQGQAADAAQRSALSHLCQMLLSSNEFLYVE